MRRPTWNIKYGNKGAGPKPKPRTSGAYWLGIWRKVKTEKSILLKAYGMKEKSIFYRLPYYKAPF